MGTGLGERALLRAVPPIDASPEPEAQLSARILSCPLGYVHDHFGAEQVERMIREAGGDPRTFVPPYGWISHALFERILEHVRRLTQTDQEFYRACAYKLKESYGPLLVLLRMSSIKQVYRLMASTSHVVSRISQFDVSDRGRGHVQVRYTSTCPESRLMCLSRQAQNQAIPALWWGVPPPSIEEHSCIAWGDAECRYDLRWKEPIRWTIAAAGAIAGASLGGVASQIGANGWAVPLLALLGLAIAWLLELRRVVVENQRASEDTSAALLELAESHQEATGELIDLHRRQQRWNQEIENLVADRTATLETIVKQLRGLKTVQNTRVQSLSHDIRNPLTVLRSCGELIRDEVPDPSADLLELLEGLDDAAERTAVLFEDLGRAASAEPTNLPSLREQVDVSTLATTLRRRLKAIVFGRDIRSTVFQTREAPTHIRVDAVLLDRVLDNLLTNAAKYTERGSILVELDGSPGNLCMRISDTGRGIAAERLERVFSGTTPDDAPLIGTSRGLGLSVVVRTLAQLQGRLEVMSRPDQGTTFWLYIPADPASDQVAQPAPEEESMASMVRRVIKIREAV